MRIAVIMSTYNGEKYLREQIESILDQEDIDIELFIRDDGSSDSTFSILSSYHNDERIHIYKGTNKGYGKSFIECLWSAKDFDYYSFSDQDDFWEKEKLKEAITLLDKRVKGNDVPAVYYSNVKITDSKLNIISTTTLENRNNSLESVFMRRSIAGCTMVLNHKLWNEIFKGAVSDEILSQGYDSFIISLCYALGGTVCFDKNAYIRYRQHDGNTVGVPYSIKNRIRKELKSFKQDRSAEALIAKEILKGWGDDISLENKDVLNCIATMTDDWRSRTHILLSGNFNTSNTELTLLEKIKDLVVENYAGGLKRIDKSDVISFDIFDTLISRDIWDRKMIYKILEDELIDDGKRYGIGFADKRIEAECNANKKHDGCAGIKQIYEEFNEGGLSFEEIEELIKSEEQLELKFCFPKYEGRILYEYCLWKRKKIVLISDMYFSKEQIIRMLNKCGYRTFDENFVFISCEIGSAKRTGKLFEDVAVRCCIAKKGWTHIGDAKRSDWLIPMRLGVHSIYIPGTINHFRYKSLYCKENQVKKTSSKNYRTGNYDAIYTTLMNNRLPWIRNNYEKFGYECLGTLLWGFTGWLSRKLQKKQYDRIYFLAREGQLLKKAFDILNEDIQSVYLPVSRKALNGAALWMIRGIEAKLESIPFPDEFGVEQIEDKLEIKLPETLKNKFSGFRFASWKDVLKYNEILNWLKLHESDIDNFSREQYTLFMKLLNLDATVQRIAIIDIGWKGTMQHNLELLLSGELKDIVVDGYYLGVTKNAKKKYPSQIMNGFLFHKIDENKVFAFSGLLEGIMTANHGSVKKYMTLDNGTVGYDCYPYEYEEDNRVSMIQNGALRLIADVRKVLFNSKNWKVPDELWSAGRIIRFGYLPNLNGIKMFHDFEFFDGDSKAMNSVKRKNLHEFKKDFKRSKWKTACLKQYFNGIPFTGQLYVMARRIRNYRKE